jgi:hypothetical protein
MTRPSARLATLLTLTFALATAAGGCHVVTGNPPTNAERADRLANGVALASGAAAWPAVRSIGFTYVVRQGNDVKAARTHLWDLKAGTDTVTIGDRPTTVDLKNGAPAASGGDAGPDQADALRAFETDSHWVSAPFRLFDPAVTREYLGRRDVLGKTYEVLRVAPREAGAGLPGGYTLYVDPYTSLITFMEFTPGGPDAPPVQASWEQYAHRQGLVISTYHKAGDQVITIENLTVAAE